jgi:hypothetical protein
MRPLRYSINITLDGCVDHRDGTNGTGPKPAGVDLTLSPPADGQSVPILPAAIHALNYAERGGETHLVGAEGRALGAAARGFNSKTRAIGATLRASGSRTRALE